MFYALKLNIHPMGLSFPNKKKIIGLLEEINFSECKPVSTPSHPNHKLARKWSESGR